MTTILSLTDWFEVIRRGTSGDQVIDILYSWKAQSEKKDAEIEQLKEAIDISRAVYDRLLADYQALKKESEGE